MSDTAEAIRLETAEIERLTAHIRAACDRLTEHEIERAAAVYVRERDLAKVLPVKRMTDAQIVASLERAHKAAQKALARGHHTADQNRVIALAAALRAEKAMAAK